TGAPRLVALAIAVLLPLSCATGGGLSVQVVNGTDDEIAVRDQLTRFQDAYDLEPFLFTRQVRIDHTRVPFSHPVLTLHTRHLDDDDLQLSTLLHEQFHWYLDKRSRRVEPAISKLREMYPFAPSGFPKGARDKHSTYLHLLVNRLEYRALVSLVGRQRADKAFAFWRNDHYTWIYEHVIRDGPAIDALLAKHALTGRTERPAE
ncbi:MAG TPA: hypothetical protein VF267_06075, partial [Gammaproteobacteria bacterium]